MNIGNLISLASGLIIGIIIALIGWSIISFGQLKDEVSELKTEVYYLQDMVYAMQGEYECAGGFSHIKTRS